VTACRTHGNLHAGAVATFLRDVADLPRPAERRLSLGWVDESPSTAAGVTPLIDRLVFLMDQSRQKMQSVFFRLGLKCNQFKILCSHRMSSSDRRGAPIIVCKPETREQTV